jgi:hypothetical protein
MSPEEERSESGAPIYRHAARDRNFEPAHGDAKSVEAIDRHLTRHLGPVETVLHEIVSDRVHVDVHVIKPAPNRNFWTLVTSGMSDRPMTVPAGAEKYRHAEVMLSLPPAWPLSQEAFKDERYYWPIRWLKLLARLPHEFETWLGTGHTVPNGDPAEPYASNTKLCCMMLAPPVLVPAEFRSLVVNDDKTIHFWAALPLYREEMDFKLKKGSDPLFDRFDQHGVSELLDPARKNVCPKKLFGLF